MSSFGSEHKRQKHRPAKEDRGVGGAQQQEGDTATMSEQKTEMSRERLVFLGNTLRHLHRTTKYLLEEIEALTKWIGEQIPKEKEEASV